jgi:mono/diheme cytochrome c family protein
MLAITLSAGCQQEMAQQPSYRALEPNGFFDDGRASRPLVKGVIPRGHLRTDLALYTGRKTRETPSPAEAPGNRRETYDNFVDTFPFEVTPEVVEHGYHRFMIFCVVCHDPLGTGRGKIVERGYTPPPSFHIDRLRTVPVGHIYAVINEGYGSMPSYAAQIPPRDRWAIVAYVRALQASQHFPIDKLPPEIRSKIDAALGSVPNSDQREVATRGDSP